MIENSKRPLILVGNGVHISKAEKNFKIFEKNKFAIYINLECK